MLRRQSPDRTPLSFLEGDSDMARRIRAFDWKNHPFGDPATWPASLKTALGICLNSAFPTCIYWGSELRLLYNDAWSAIPGPRHPACLGEPAKEVWSDIWHVIEPQFTRVIEGGQGIFLEDQMLPMNRYGFEEETYWTYSFTPVRRADGTIEGIFNSGHETTETILKQRERELLLNVSDRLRTLTDPVAEIAAVCGLLGDFLGAIRVGVRELKPDSEIEPFPISAEWTADGIAPVGERLSFDDLGPISSALTEGRVVRLDDLSAQQGEAADHLVREFGAQSVMGVPFLRGDKLIAVLFVHRDKPRRWTTAEVIAVEQVFERLLHTLDLRRGLAREKMMMREIDHRARNTLGVVGSLIRRTTASDLESFREKLLDRLAALSQTHSLLAERDWAGAALRDLVERELAPYMSDGAAILIEGPPVGLLPKTAQTIAMVLHELTTNAAKYGALAAPGGQLTVSWQLQDSGDLALIWKETGLDLDDAASPTGFGTTLIRQLVQGQLDGQIAVERTGERFRYRFEFPIEETAEVASLPISAASERRTDQGRFLVVEDDAIIAIDVTGALESFGYSVEATAHTLAAARRALDEKDIDAAVLDVNLGSGSSEPLAELLVERGVPCLIVTGYEGDFAPTSAFAKLPRIVKPFDDRRLEEEVRRLFTVDACV